MCVCVCEREVGQIGRKHAEKALKQLQKQFDVSAKKVSDAIAFERITPTQRDASDDRRVGQKVSVRQTRQVIQLNMSQLGQILQSAKGVLRERLAATELQHAQMPASAHKEFG